MKIETTHGLKFKAEILDALQNEPDVKEEITKCLKNNLTIIFEKSLSSAIKNRKYLRDDVIEISVSVGIGNPEDGDE